MSNSKMSLWFLLAVGLILAVAGLLVSTISVLLFIFAGIAFGIFINGIAGWLQRWFSLPYVVAYLIVVTVLFLSVAVGFYFLGAQIASRTNELWSQLQTAVTDLQNWLQQQAWAKKYLPEMSEVKQTLSKSGNSIAPGIINWIGATGWALTGLLVIVFVGLYSAFDPVLYRSGLIQLFPKRKRPTADHVLQKVHANLGLWMVGRFASMAMVGVLTAIGLWILGVPLAATLGVLAAFLTFIPNIGPLVAAIPQVLLALNVDGMTAVYVLIFNVLLQGIESYLITPIIQRNQVSLPPILLISSQVLMGVGFGVIGVMMAAPLVVVTIVLVQTLYIERILGDESEGD